MEDTHVVGNRHCDAASMRSLQPTLAVTVLVLLALVTVATPHVQGTAGESTDHGHSAPNIVFILAVRGRCGTAHDRTAVWRGYWPCYCGTWRLSLTWPTTRRACRPIRQPPCRVLSFRGAERGGL